MAHSSAMKKLRRQFAAERHLMAPRGKALKTTTPSAKPNMQARRPIPTVVDAGSRKCARAPPSSPRSSSCSTSRGISIGGSDMLRCGTRAQVRTRTKLPTGSYLVMWLHATICGASKYEYIVCYDGEFPPEDPHGPVTVMSDHVRLPRTAAMVSVVDNANASVLKQTQKMPSTQKKPTQKVQRPTVAGKSMSRLYRLEKEMRVASRR